MLDLTASINKIDMLCALYFKGQKFNTQEYDIGYMPIIEITRKKKRITDESWLDAFNISNQYINDNRIKLHDLCKKLMDSHGY